MERADMDLGCLPAPVPSLRKEADGLPLKAHHLHLFGWTSGSGGFVVLLQGSGRLLHLCFRVQGRRCRGLLSMPRQP